MKRRTINIMGKAVGGGQPCFIVAEAGVNHNGSLELAKKLVVAAKKSGADAVKFQIFIPEEIVSPDAAKADYQKETTGEGSQYEMLKRLALSEGEFEQLRDYANEVGIIFFATPHDLSSVNIFDRLDLPIIKIASPDADNALLFKKLASNERLRTRPLFLSTGGCTMEEVRRSLRFLKDSGFIGSILLYHCVSAYPAPPEDQNLRVIETYMKEFPELVVGFSDNTGDIDILKAAVYLGASSIETNITMDRKMKGPDHRISNDPEEFALMVREVRAVENGREFFKPSLASQKIKKSLGDGNKRQMPSETSTIKIARKSIVASRNIQEGTVVTLDCLAARRPGDGLSPMAFKKLVNKKVVHQMSKWERFTLSDVK